MKKVVLAVFTLGVFVFKSKNEGDGSGSFSFKNPEIYER